MLSELPQVPSASATPAITAMAISAAALAAKATANRIDLISRLAVEAGAGRPIHWSA
jgi:hypothetical protein